MPPREPELGVAMDEQHQRLAWITILNVVQLHALQNKTLHQLDQLNSHSLKQHTYVHGGVLAHAVLVLHEALRCVRAFLHDPELGMGLLEEHHHDHQHDLGRVEQAQHPDGNLLRHIANRAGHGECRTHADRGVCSE